MKVIKKILYKIRIIYVFNKCPPLDPLRRAYIHPFRFVLDSNRSGKREREKVLQYE